MDLPNRKSTRLKGFDYSQEGYYFVTICTKDREYLFGDITNGKMVLNEMGRMVYRTIRETPKIRKNVQIDTYQIMPNHVHAIIVITEQIYSVGAYCNTPLRSEPQLQSPSQTVGSIVRGIKSVAAAQIRIIIDNPQFPVWQRNYFEHIIRNERELSKIREYIRLNPGMWERDRNNPENLYI